MCCVNLINLLLIICYSCACILEAVYRNEVSVLGNYKFLMPFMVYETSYDEYNYY